MPAAVPLDVGDDVAGHVRVGLVCAEPVAVAPSGDDLLAEIRTSCADLEALHAGRAPSAIEGLAPARRLYKSFGIDPTRTRPSSEALLRRVLKGKGLYRILNAVDLANYCSLQFLLPLGLYDAGRIRGRVVLRRGCAGESYPGIRKDDVHLEGRPVLADDEGPFGNPTSDSLRTSVSPETRSLWMVIFAPREYPRESLGAHVRGAREAMAHHLAPDGTVTETTGSLLPDP